MGRLEGKVAVITGAAGGLGRSHAIRLAQEGASIVALDIARQIDSVPYPLSTPIDLEQLVAALEARGVRAVGWQADVRSRPELDVAIAAAVDEFGHVDTVIANAGIAPMHVENRPDAWSDAIDVNLTGVYNTIEAALPAMTAPGGGSITIVSSTAGLNGIGGPSAGGLAYAASKHGVVGLMRSYANILGEKWIRVNSVHPTGVETRMTVDEAIVKFAARDPKMSEEAPNLLPVSVIEAVDVSNAILWLASDEARYVTGVALPVDAGFTVRK
jgi:SDR family mycofactocin-dependent oxidoreductase